MSAEVAPHLLPGAWASLRRNLRRAFGTEPNPLCRQVDRSRSRLLVALALTVAALIAAGVVAGLTVLHLEQAGARPITAHRHQVAATTLSAAVADPAHLGGPALAQAVWDYPPTGRITGSVAVPPTTGAGSGVRIWVDDHGNAATAPPSGIDMAAYAGFAGLGTFAVGWLIAEAGYTARRRVLDGRAELGWEPEWEQVEPLWSGRHRHHPESGQQ